MPKKKTTKKATSENSKLVPKTEDKKARAKAELEKKKKAPEFRVYSGQHGLSVACDSPVTFRARARGLDSGHDRLSDWGTGGAVVLGMLHVGEKYLVRVQIDDNGKRGPWIDVEAEVQCGPDHDDGLTRF